MKVCRNISIELKPIPDYNIIRDSPRFTMLASGGNKVGDWIADENQTTSLLILADNSLPVRSYNYSIVVK